MDRQRKIKLLRDIESGLIRVESLAPKTFRLRISCPVAGGKAICENYINDKPVDSRTYSEQLEKAITESSEPWKIDCKVIGLENLKYGYQQ